jgi:hypothetical protein
MAEHYEKNKKAMEELVKYADQALDDSAYVDLEFEDEEAEIFHVSSKSDSKISSNWNDAAERRKDSLMKVVGLTPDEFEDIRHHLERIGCIGIKKDTSHPNGKTVIYFCRLGMGRYSFILYDNPISQEEKDEFMKSYEYIPYSDRVIFQYGGGAFGKQYFTTEERGLFDEIKVFDLISCNEKRNNVFFFCKIFRYINLFNAVVSMSRSCRPFFNHNAIYEHLIRI